MSGLGDIFLGNSVPDEISWEKCPAGQELLSHPRKLCPRYKVVIYAVGKYVLGSYITL